ncbi:protein of unknown function [Candidatus Methylopumilus planktonicus]|uniref:Uncharacterized protein n=1 Tax=Candidatus Methylopumilus planktonicus TaxID=1581557 RepID=A0A0D6EYD2_9PROT|nr:protein of unknown function [Candidatus Methylopumilus planktonicus]
MLKKAKELFFRFRTRHFKFIECRKSLRFDTSGYYPYQIMEIGESFLIDNVNVETIQKKHETINKELSKIF